MTAPAPSLASLQEPSDGPGRLRPHLDVLVVIAFVCATGDAISTYYLLSTGLAREGNPVIAQLVERQPWCIFLCVALLWAPVPFLPKLARLTAATGLAVGHGLCALINTSSWLFDMWLTEHMSFGVIAAVPAVAALGVLVTLRLTRLRKESTIRIIAWLAGYGTYVALLGLGCWLAGTWLSS